MSEDAAPVTILVVDDEPSLLRLISRVLEKKGYLVLTAASGDQAIEVFDKHRGAIDGVILDVVIPPNGVSEVFDHIVSARGDLAPILVSGDMPEAAIGARIAKHEGAFLRKPFLPRALLALVEAGLAGSRAARCKPGREA